MLNAIAQVDGWIARRYPSQKSLLGAALDPIADKALIVTLTVGLASAGLLPGNEIVLKYSKRAVVPLAGLIFARDAGLMTAAFAYRYITLRKTITGPVRHYNVMTFVKLTRASRSV